MKADILYGYASDDVITRRAAGKRPLLGNQGDDYLSGGAGKMMRLERRSRGRNYSGGGARR